MQTGGSAHGGCPRIWHLTVGFLLLGLEWSVSTAAIRVPQDYSTIALGLQHAASGDTVVIACGTYFEHGLQVPGGVTVRSESGSAACVTIDGEYQGSILVCSDASISTLLEGLSLVHGGGLAVDSDDGGGLHAVGSTVQLRQCRIEACFAGYQGGGVYAEQSTVQIVGCEFRENGASGEFDGCGYGGAIYAFQSDLEIGSSEFIENGQLSNCGGGGGALYCSQSVLAVSDCQFVRNLSYQSAGAIRLSSTSASFLGSLFDENGADTGSSFACDTDGSLTLEGCVFIRPPQLSSVGCEIYNAYGQLSVRSSTLVTSGTSWQNAFIESRADPEISSCLFVLAEGIKAFECGQAVPQFDCCNIYSPVGAAWVDCYADQLGVNGNFSADPEFCGIPGSGDYYLQSDSPCAPANNSCGVLIGALPVGCEGVSTQATSMSAIKSLY